MTQFFHVLPPQVPGTDTALLLVDGFRVKRTFLSPSFCKKSISEFAKVQGTPCKSERSAGLRMADSAMSRWRSDVSHSAERGLEAAGADGGGLDHDVGERRLERVCREQHRAAVQVQRPRRKLGRHDPDDHDLIQFGGGRWGRQRRHLPALHRLSPRGCRNRNTQDNTQAPPGLETGSKSCDPAALSAGERLPGQREEGSIFLSAITPRTHLLQLGWQHDITGGHTSARAESCGGEVGLASERTKTKNLQVSSTSTPRSNTSREQPSMSVDRRRCRHGPLPPMQEKTFPGQQASVCKSLCQRLCYVDAESRDEASCCQRMCPDEPVSNKIDTLDSLIDIAALTFLDSEALPLRGRGATHATDTPRGSARWGSRSNCQPPNHCTNHINFYGTSRLSGVLARPSAARTVDKPPLFLRRGVRVKELGLRLKEKYL